jgi:hypothetical protein
MRAVVYISEEQFSLNNLTARYLTVHAGTATAIGAHMQMQYILTGKDDIL